MSGEPTPGLIGDTHRMANALDALVRLYAHHLEMEIANRGWNYDAWPKQGLDAILADYIQAETYDPRVPSRKAEDHDQ